MHVLMLNYQCCDHRKFDSVNRALMYVAFYPHLIPKIAGDYTKFCLLPQSVTLKYQNTIFEHNCAKLE